MLEYLSGFPDGKGSIGNSLTLFLREKEVVFAGEKYDRNTIETDLKPDADFFSSGKMKNIFNVNLGATYRFNDSVHLLVQANNIFAQHYNLYYGMPAQRFNIMAGVGVCF